MIPSPGVKIPTMRSPGTAPPSGANRTGNSLLIPRMGMAVGWVEPGTLNLTDVALLSPNQPPSDLGGEQR